MEFITWLDYLLLPIYLFVIYTIANGLKDRLYPVGHALRPYFIPGLIAKITGALFIGMIYQYYYGGGDTGYYFIQARYLNSVADESWGKWFNLLLGIPDYWDGEYMMHTTRLEWYGTGANWVVISITAIINLITFNTFLPTSIIFAALCYTGIWAMFKSFTNIYPDHTRALAISFLFIPSCFIWGSGIFKDTICMFALGWMTAGVFKVMIARKLSPNLLILTILGFFLIIKTKIYIILAFAPALMIWVLFAYSYKFKNPTVRRITIWTMMGFAFLLFNVVMNRYSAELGGYSLDRIAETSNITRDWILYSSGDQGSAYDLGPMDGSLSSMLLKFPLAVNVSLYRPYLWEVRNPLALMNSIESSIFLFFTIQVLLANGFRGSWRIIKSDPNIQFALIFTIIFAFAVGISTYNFGSLSRYRIPCLPFFVYALLMIHLKGKKPQDKLLGWLPLN